ncbi:MAG: rhomboid family intramembrane serine protease [Oligosphaeraceae bacterium]|nr:rhomboid family intramembrane serine protease [Oligosphaeraceae bacterium]
MPVLEAERFLPWLAVLASQDIDYTIEDVGRQQFLILNRRDFPAALQELALYEENAAKLYERQVRLSEPMVGREAKHSFSVSAFAFAALYFILLLRFHVFVSELTPSWRHRGVWHGEHIRQGQLWRCITSLTLHADYAHLLSNLFWGCILLTLAGSILGTGWALLLMLSSGALANLLNAYIFPQAHYRALGASTAVFALLGILCAHAGMRNMYSAKNSENGLLQQMQPILPLLAGLAILAAWGTAAKSDLAGHASGFFCGLLTGFFSLKIPAGLRTWPWQFMCWLGAGLLHLLAWQYAMR